MDFKNIHKVKSKGEARSIAIDYQNWASEQNLSYGELAKHQRYFRVLGKKFGLLREFKREGIL